MITKTIIQVAASSGWAVAVNVIEQGRITIDFRRKTESSVPFRFSADMTDNDPATLVADIISFVDAFHPGQFAREWCRLSGAGASRYSQTAADMDDIRARAWLLAIDLSDAVRHPGRFAPPWYHWN